MSVKAGTRLKEGGLKGSDDLKAESTVLARIASPAFTRIPQSKTEGKWNMTSDQTLFDSNLGAPIGGIPGGV
jgi:hypothetical protein